ncbi:hypothetical protein [Micromonospora sp. CPCC 206061]|uniref:hypothetical protein n=1 Tax=Micromonospora sp. CPCC 206061 TaxID=3122410 RepID=UPI002FEF5516
MKLGIGLPNAPAHPRTRPRRLGTPRGGARLSALAPIDRLASGSSPEQTELMFIPTVASVDEVDRLADAVK